MELGTTKVDELTFNELLALNNWRSDDLNKVLPARAILAAGAFAGSTDRLADFKQLSSPADFSFGARTATYLTTADSLAVPVSSATADAILKGILEDDEKLAEALDAHREDPLLAGWRDVIRRLEFKYRPTNLVSTFALPPDPDCSPGF
ncbi:hypothetical protein AB1Y20_021785 [Prymnesium parvum]|uniref:Uncharacterized protein n=1 Tax=Prymnesium parvum TaxID=97485 RepID=A0AB34JMF7_PRYPA